MSAAWTTRSLLAWMGQDFAAHGLASPRLDAELLVAHVLQQDRVGLYMDLDRPLTAAELAAVRALVVRRRRREPVAYLIGRREFFGRTFDVTPAVLVPRPETETLVERALQLAPKDRAARVLDLCTGSGAIAVSLAAERPNWQLTATDLSADALVVARANAARHAVSERVALRQGDLFEALGDAVRFDLIVANPPYVAAAELPALAPELQHEPALALAGGPAGLDVLSRLSAQAPSWIAPGGAILLEVGAGQAPLVAAALAEQPGLCEVRTHRDLGGIERVVEARAS